MVNATSAQISYAVSHKYKKSLINSNAGAVIIDKKLMEHCPSNALLVENVYLAYSILTHKFKHYQNINHFKTASQLKNFYSKVNIAESCIILHYELNTEFVSDCTSLISTKWDCLRNRLVIGYLCGDYGRWLSHCHHFCNDWWPILYVGRGYMVGRMASCFGFLSCISVLSNK